MKRHSRYNNIKEGVEPKARPNCMAVDATAQSWEQIDIICVQSHQNDAYARSYMLLIYSFYICPYLCPLSRELSNDEA